MLQIDKKYQLLKFKLVAERDGSLILKFKNKSIFFISSGLGMENTILNRICEDYLRIVSPREASGQSG